MIPEYCKTILVLIIFSTFSDRQTFMMVTESKTSCSREAKKEKPEAFPDTPKELLATIKRTVG